MKKTIFTFLLLSAFLITQAQNNFKKGYIIKTNGVQMNGSINYTSDADNGKVCVFKNSEGKITRYKPGEISGYKFDKDGFYVSRYLKTENGVRKIFALYLVKGPRSAYFLRDAAGFHYLLEFNKDTLRILPYDQTTISEDGGMYERPHTAYIEYLKLYFKSQPSLYRQIESMKKPGFNTIIRLTKKYNQLTCGDSCSTVYYKQPSIKIGIEPRFEAVFGRFSKLAFDANMFTEVGGSLYIRLNRAGEGWALRTGILGLFTVNNNSFKFSNYYKIPFRIQYTFTNTKLIQPKLDFGVDLYTYKIEPGSLFFTGSAGVLVKITKQIFLDLGAETIVHSATTEGGFFIGYSVASGVYFKL